MLLNILEVGPHNHGPSSLECQPCWETGLAQCPDFIDKNMEVGAGSPAQGSRGPPAAPTVPAAPCAGREEGLKGRVPLGLPGSVLALGRALSGCAGSQ